VKGAFVEENFLALTDAGIKRFFLVVLVGVGAGPPLCRTVFSDSSSSGLG
jgi:hypothetical protein